MLPSFLSPVALYGSYLRRCFSAAGLSPQTLDIDDETTMHFWGPDPARSGGAGGKPALVLIHGFGPVATWQWRRQVQFFAPKLDVYVPDLVFFGESTTKSAERTEVFQAAAVARLMERIGVKRYSLMGTSYGGIVAYNVARIWPERVEKVVIASSGVNMRLRDGKALLKRANLEKTEDLMLPSTAKQLRTLLRLAVFKQPNVMPEFVLNDLVNKLYSQKRNEKMELLKELTIGRDDETKLSPLDKDVLIVWGDHDMIFPFEMAAELKELLGKKVRLEVMKNTGHIPQTEKPALFNEIVNKFLCEAS
ncbi:4,5-9,10-diseco-3-hydroxy-5,9,17-trioxoandrosta-1(10), 2-diene-4-oate hydrolase [Morus notabilis]|uniref:4,5-9,10-diseco-3-hydroxy-5,9, 17-trioxoandrosta-1(10), 2-diene-4-oate hydrolase n=1 Tax=Morus notabilis TaxID=981085 RepID=W9R6Z9_9ROSA|nr:uncharacterized protein LOC21401583 [Morus notabilis]EXB74908.1 4,5-9,10-diseco-3-hydroxy-5,9,17-trioxoandrosta-1(10), 2-diene-4-oate hydrolase [Morus notabilis]